MTRFSRYSPFFLTIAKLPCKIKHTLPAAGCQLWRIIPLYIFSGFCYTVPRPENADRRVLRRFFIIEAIILATRTKRKMKQALSFWSILIRTLPVFAGMLCFCSARWFVSTYGRIGFDSVLFTLTSGLSGVQSGLITAYLRDALLPAVLLTAVICLLLFILPGRKIKWIPKWITAVFSLLLTLGLIVFAAFDVQLVDYLFSSRANSDLYEQEYVDPATAVITFPEQKRNLIYIFLESMETTYLSRELGGAEDVNLIPELYDLALDNINFSNHEGVGGFHSAPGATWTIGAMVSHTAGIPLKTPMEDYNAYGEGGTPFLPGVTSLSNILHDNGYYQSLMVGSFASFGGRRSYYTQHGTDVIYDLGSARRDGIVPSDYFEWWGMEDLYLFEYAKLELTRIAAQEQPFAFTMLTVDTHHIGGYQCALCGDTHEEQYENVISCSSRQVLDFVQWIQEQDFYENTTVIICGDHCSMDKGYFSRNIDSGYERLVYNCFINSAVTTDHTKNRDFCAVDLFPTTLTAMGCTIEGDRLGLGVNLFSNLPTLTERMGYPAFSGKLAMASEYYTANFYSDADRELIGQDTE